MAAPRVEKCKPLTRSATILLVLVFTAALLECGVSRKCIEDGQECRHASDRCCTQNTNCKIEDFKLVTFACNRDSIYNDY